MRFPKLPAPFPTQSRSFLIHLPPFPARPVRFPPAPAAFPRGLGWFPVEPGRGRGGPKIFRAPVHLPIAMRAGFVDF